MRSEAEEIRKMIEEWRMGSRKAMEELEKVLDEEGGEENENR